MARNQKKSLSYFPFDVDFFSDDKIQLVSARFGIKGEIVAIKLLCKIYSTNGYYYQWGEDEALLFAKGVGDGCQHSLVNDIVHELVKRGFFDRSIFDRFKILTSNGIQQRYLTICKQLKREVEIIDNLNCTSMFLLKKSLETNNSGIIQEKPPNIPEKTEEIPEENTQKKRKEKKGKEMKEKCVENPVWIEQTCMVFKTNAHTLLNFCNEWIDKAEIQMKFEQYGINALIGFMLKDFEKENPQKIVAQKNDLTTNDKYLEFENRQKMQHGRK